MDRIGLGFLGLDRMNFDQVRSDQIRSGITWIWATGLGLGETKHQPIDSIGYAKYKAQGKRTNGGDGNRNEQWSETGNGRKGIINLGLGWLLGFFAVSIPRNPRPD